MISLNTLIENFTLLDNWEDKYRLLIELGEELPNLNENQKTLENKVDGCISQVWLIIRKNNNKLEFLADSDAKIVKGLICILLITYNQKTPQEIQNIKINDIFQKLNLDSHLSINRRNGFFSIVKKIIEISQVQTVN